MKKRIIAFLSAILIVVGIMPAPAFATDSSVTVSTTVCNACGNEVCTCESASETTEPTQTPVDNCVYCEGTTAEDGTVTHAEGCNAAYVYDGSVDVNKYAQLIEVTDFYTVSDRNCSIEDGGLYYSEFEEGTVFHITGWYWDPATTALWYQVEFYSGGVVAEAAEYWPEDAWILQDYTDTTYEYESSLEFLPTCNTCGKPDCSGEHESPEIVDGKEVPDKTGTVVIKGTLPTDATVKFSQVTDSAILDELGIEDGFVADISVLSSGVVWQPNGTVTITLMVDGEYPIITHYLDDVDAVTAALARDEYNVIDVSAKSEATKELLAPAIKAYQTATGTTEEKVAIEWITNVQDNGDGTISFTTDSFSVYSASTANYMTEVDVSSGFNLVGKSALFDEQNKIYYAGMYYITKGSTLEITDGSTTAKNWSLYWNDFGTAIGGSDACTGADINGTYVSLDPGTDNFGTWRDVYHATITVSNSTDAVGGIIQVNMNAQDGNLYFVHFKVIDAPITVTFNPNGGSVTPTSAFAAPGLPIALPTPTRSGYVFAGWSDGTKAYNNVYTAPASNVTLTAQWAAPVNVTFVGNGGTVNGSATYVMQVGTGVITVWPHADTWTDSNGVTYYFDGWYSDPTGGVPVGEINIAKSSAQGNTATSLVFEHAVTADTTVYAHWTSNEDLANGKNFIMIGLINNYYIPVSNGGGYPIGKVTYESYHQFPNEPVGVGHENTYRVDDRSPDWTLRLHGKDTYPLVGSPNDYIYSSILSATAYYKPSPVDGDSTMGVFDSDGSDVYMFLKFDETDKKQIIERWLEVIISERDDYDPSVAARVKADLEDYYGVDFTNKTAADLVDDFKLIPYVVKHHPDMVGEIGWWVVDMIIVPKSLVTLGYDLNIPTGYSLASGVAPASSTYELTNPATNASVVQVPSVVVSKTVNGNPVYATFSHWKDSAGNTYGGNTGNNTIAMDDDKMLQAVWIVTESIPGSLTVTKNIRADDGHVAPEGIPAFSFSFNIDTTNCTTGDPYISAEYSYTIYDGGTIVSTGKIGNGGTFTLQDGWAIHIENLPSKADIKITETNLPQYFIPAKTVEERTISAGQNTSLTFTNAYPRVYYKVEHYLQPDNYSTNLNDYVLQETETLVGTVGEQTAAAHKTEGVYAEYVHLSYTQMEISATGDTVVKIYYNKNIYTSNLEIVKKVVKAYSRDTWTSDTFTFTVIPAAGITLSAANYPVTIGGTTTNVAPSDNKLQVSIPVSMLDTSVSAVISGLPLGNYTVTETVPNGYQVDSNNKSVTVNSTNTVTASFVNTYLRHLGRLTISKTATGGSAGDTFIFHISGNGVDMDVTITGSGSVTIYDLPMGTYTVTEDTSWSWRYTTTDAQASASLTVGTPDVTVTFINTYKENQWLNYFANIPNIFGKKEDEQEGS